MTVISEPITTLAGVGDRTPVTFYVQALRPTFAGVGIITPTRVQVLPEGGVLTTPDLDPGPATVSWGTSTYRITIPDEPDPVALWPLIDAGMPVPSNEPGFVRNAGGIARIARITESAYAALTTPDPETLYITFEG
ncbi:hypothetical protein [Rhodococcus jostii]|uniref:phage upper tail fiber protein n=1 Tax=Rhodococcus jostii TaxID=132919 RepID=UPI0036519A90